MRPSAGLLRTAAAEVYNLSGSPKLSRCLVAGTAFHTLITFDTWDISRQEGPTPLYIDRRSKGELVLLACTTCWAALSVKVVQRTVQAVGQGMGSRKVKSGPQRAHPVAGLHYAAVSPFPRKDVVMKALY